MRKFLLKVIRFLPFYTVALIGFELIGQIDYRVHYHLIGMSTHWGSVNQRILEWKSETNRKKKSQVLFFGSSTCYEAIDPSELIAYGYDGFSFCSFSQTIGTSLALLKATIDEAVNTKIVCLDLYPAAWQANPISVESTQDWIINADFQSWSWSKELIKCAWKSKDIHTIGLSLTFPIVKYFGLYEHNAPPDNLGIYKGRGFVHRTMPGLGEKPNCNDIEVSFSKEHEAYLDEAKQLCASRGIQLVLIIPPQLCPEDFEYPNSWKSLHVINGQNWSGSDSTVYYRDDHHLVRKGAQSYSKWLIPQVLSRIEN